MNAIRTAKNMYRGINAHLHSALQAQPGWMGFHTLHIAHLAESLTAQLWPLGYRVDIENGMQIRDSADGRRGQARADIAIYPAPAGQPAVTLPTSQMAANVLTMPSKQLLALETDDDLYYKAIIIYEQDDKIPVAWLELLSPSNKTDHAYIEKRWRLLQRGIVFIELDYLHETASTFAALPSYPAGGRAYRIVVVDPRPTVENGTAYLAAFSVDEAIPTVPVPLLGGHIAQIAFDPPYQRSFEALLYGLQTDIPTDYAQFPVGWRHYAPADQARIAARMVAVIDAVGRGESLDVPPAAEPLPLAESLTRLAAHGVTVPEGGQP